MYYDYEKDEFHQEVEVRVSELGRETVAMVNLETPLTDNRSRHVLFMAAHGIARKRSKDPKNLEVGARLALGRAFVSLGNQLIRDAMGTVKHTDDMKEQKAKQAARKQEREEARRKFRQKQTNQQNGKTYAVATKE